MPRLTRVNGSSLIKQQSLIHSENNSLLYSSLFRIVETTPSPRPPDAETDSTGEGTDRRETTDIMSPDPDIAMDTSGVVPVEQDQALDTEKIEIIASTLEEICTFLNQAEHLIVSGVLQTVNLYDITHMLQGCTKYIHVYVLFYEGHMRMTATPEIM